MKVEVKKAYKNQKCMECGGVIMKILKGTMTVSTPNCASDSKSWRLCEKCAPIVKN